MEIIEVSPDDFIASSTLFLIYNLSKKDNRKDVIERKVTIKVQKNLAFAGITIDYVIKAGNPRNSYVENRSTRLLDMFNADKGDTLGEDLTMRVSLGDRIPIDVINRTDSLKEEIDFDDEIRPYLTDCGICRINNIVLMHSINRIQLLVKNGSVSLDKDYRLEFVE